MYTVTAGTSVIGQPGQALHPPLMDWDNAPSTVLSEVQGEVKTFPLNWSKSETICLHVPAPYVEGRDIIKTYISHFITRRILFQYTFFNFYAYMSLIAYVTFAAVCLPL